MNKKTLITFILVGLFTSACGTGKSWSEIQAEVRQVHLRVHTGAIDPVVPAALQEIHKYKAECGGHYCNAHSKRAREVKNIVWHALGYVPVDAKPGTVFRDLINEWEEFQRAG